MKKSISEKLKEAQERKPDAFAIIGAVSGFGEKRIKEIAEGSEMTISEKIVLEGLAEDY